MSWTLEIFHSGATQTYAADLIEQDDDAAVAERLQADTVEQANIKLSIDETFLGASSIFDLPTGDGSGALDWRARVLYDGFEALNGIVRRRGGVQHDPDEERWNVTVLASGAGDFLERLEAVPLKVDGERNPAVIANAVRVELINFDGNKFFIDCYLLDSVWDAVVGLTTDVTFTSPTLFEYETEYITGGVTETITRVGQIAIHTFDRDPRIGFNHLDGPSTPKDLPDITGRQLFEALQIMEGWRIEANYAAYPSRAIDVEAFVDSEALAFGAGADLDDPADAVVELAGRPILDIEDPEYPDLAVAYLFDAIDPEAILHTEATDAPRDPLTHWLVSPAPAGQYAAEVRQLDPDGRPANETVLTVPFHQPWVGDIQLITGQNPFSGTDPNYEERWAVAGFAALPVRHQAKGVIFEVGREDGEVTDRYKMIINRSVTAVGGIPASQDEFFCAVWAQQALRKYVLSRRELFTCEVSVDALDQDAFQVGRPGEGVQYLSRTWMVAERQFEPVNERTELLLKTPTTEDPPDVPPGTEPERLNPPHAITAGCVCDEVNSEFDLTLSWSAPITGLTPTSYEVEYMAWYQETWQTGTDTAATSWSFSHATNGSERGSFFFRIRSVLTNGSGEEQVSPWVHGRVACTACGEDAPDEDEEPGVGGGGVCYEMNEAVAVVLAGATTSAYVTPLLTPMEPLQHADYRFDAQARGIMAKGVQVYAEAHPTSRNLVRAVLELGQYSGGAALDQDVTVDIKITRYLKEHPDCWSTCWVRGQWHAGPDACLARVALPFDDPDYQHADWWSTKNFEHAPHARVFEVEGVPKVFIMEDWRWGYSTDRPGAENALRCYLWEPPRWNVDGVVTGNTWTKIASHPIAATVTSNYEPNPAVAALDDTIYAYTVTDAGSASVGHLHRYNAALDTWTPLADLPTNPDPTFPDDWYTTFANLEAMDGYLWLIPGNVTSVSGTLGGVSVQRLVWRYEPGTDTWTTDAAWAWPSTTLYQFKSTCVFEGRLWVFGGVDVTTETNLVWSFHPSTGWQAEQNLAAARARPNIVVSNEKDILLLGGHTQANSPWNETDFTTNVSSYIYDHVAGAHQFLNSPSTMPRLTSAVMVPTTFFDVVGFDGNPRDAAVILPATELAFPLYWVPYDALPANRAPYNGSPAI